MSATTLWKDTTSQEFEIIINTMLSPIPDDERSSKTFWQNVNCRKVFDQHQVMSINGDDVAYNAIHYRYEQVTSKDEPEEDRVLQKNGLIVIYRYNGNIYYIVDQNTTAQKLLRKLLSYTGRGEIICGTYSLPGDFFVWLVNKVYNNETEIINIASGITKALTIDEIKGIKGDTEDEQTVVTSSGESVMAVISTLSFLLESRKLNQLILMLKYTDDHLRIGLKLTKNTVECIKPYVGSFNQGTIEQTLSKLYLLVYLEIIPLLIEKYKVEKESAWNRDTYVLFLERLKDEILKKIDEKIDLFRPHEGNDSCIIGGAVN